MENFKDIKKPHKTLKIWDKCIDFVALLYKKLEKFPSEELYGLSSQMKRSSISIPSNIAEGAARNSRKEYKHFLYVARGSISELDAQFEIANKLKILSSKDYDELSNSLIEISKMLNGLIKSL